MVHVRLDGGRSAAALFVDRVDVTALAQRSGGEIRWRPGERLPPGPHEVEVVVADPEGPTKLRWTFTVAPQGGSGGEPLALSSRGSLSLTGSKAVARQGAPGGVSGTGNLGLALAVSRGEAEASLESSLGWSSSGAAPRFAPGGFLATVKRAQDSLLFGDVSFQGTPYTAAALSRRGLLLTLQHLDATLQAFQVGSRSVRGLDAGVRFGDDGDQLYGGAVRTSLFRDQPLQVSAVFLQGRSASGSSYNVASTDGPSEGRAMGLQVAGTLLGTSLSAEGALSRHDVDTGDAEGARSDGAFSLRLGRQVGPVSLSGAWERVGPAYASIASPSTARDRQQMALSAAAALGPATLSASLGRQNDNLGRDVARPVVVNTSAGTSLGLSPPGWPGLTLAYVRGALGATSLPAGHPGVDSATDTGTAALSFARGGWSANLAASLSRLDDRKTGSDAVTRSLQLSASARPSERLSVAPALARAETRTAGVTRTTDLASLSLGLSVLPRLLTLSGQGSFGSNRASDGSARADQWGAAVRVGWEIQRLFARWWTLGGAALAASGRYDRVRDRGPQGGDGEVYGAFVSLDLSLPLDARVEP